MNVYNTVQTTDTEEQGGGSGDFISCLVNRRREREILGRKREDRQAGWRKIMAFFGRRRHQSFTLFNLFFCYRGRGRLAKDLDSVVRCFFLLVIHHHIIHGSGLAGSSLQSFCAAEKREVSFLSLFILDLDFDLGEGVGQFWLSVLCKKSCSRFASL